MDIEAALIPEEHARAIMFDLEEKEKRGTNILRMNNQRYLDLWKINPENPRYNTYKQFMFIATQLVNLYQRSQRNSSLPEEPLRFGSVAEIRGRRNGKKIAKKTIERYPQERENLIISGMTSYEGLMRISMLVRENAV